MELCDNPVMAGFSEDHLERGYGLMEEAVKSGSLMGGAVQVARDGKLLPARSFGRSELKVDGAEVDADTVFLVASITKPVVVAGVMRLVETGKVTLDDSVEKIVPEFGCNGKDRVRVRHLMTHTSGLPDQLPDNLELRKQLAPHSRFVERICEIPLEFTPGTRISYQSCGIAMLGEIVERLSGMPLRVFLSQGSPPVEVSAGAEVPVTLVVELSNTSGELASRLTATAQFGGGDPVVLHPQTSPQGLINYSALLAVPDGLERPVLQVKLRVDDPDAGKWEWTRKVTLRASGSGESPPRTGR